MELVATTIIILVTLWYFGSLINKMIVKAEVILDGSAEMATDEFAGFRRDQKIRLHKTRIRQSETLDGIKDATCYSDNQFDDIFAVVSGTHDDEPVKPATAI